MLKKWLNLVKYGHSQTQILATKERLRWLSLCLHPMFADIIANLKLVFFSMFFLDFRCFFADVLTDIMQSVDEFY